MPDRSRADDPLVALLGAGETALPRADFRRDLRERLITQPPPPVGLTSRPIGRVLVGSLVAVGLAVVAVSTWVLLRGVAPPRDASAPFAAPVMDVAEERDAVRSSAPESSRLPPTRSATRAATEASTVEPPLAPVVVATSLPATATGVVATPTSIPVAPIVAAEDERPRPVATSLGDAPEQTPRPVTRVPETATATLGATRTPTTPSGALPATPTPAPTGVGWPTLAPPATETPGAALGSS